MLNFLTKLFGDKKAKDIKELQPLVEEINRAYEKLRGLSDDDLRKKSQDLKKQVKEYVSEFTAKIESLRKDADKEEDILAKDQLYNQIDEVIRQRDEKYEEILQQILPEAFAVVKDTARRLTENKQLVVTATDWDRKFAAEKEHVVIDGDKAIWKNKWDAAGSEIEWNMVHYDVQLMGGIVLHMGKIAEMATGEGKTLVSTLPVFLNALTGEGVHVVTVNDYLARRDAEWNAPLYQFHMLSVDCIDRYEPNSDERKIAYRNDVVYGTNNEFGFDYLRDNMTTHPEHLVQRKHHYAIIDEIDSVLIDEARTPLIISGPVPRGDIHEFNELKPRIEKLVRQQRTLANQLLTDAKKLLESDKKEEVEKGSLYLFRVFRGLPAYKPLIKFLGEPGVRSQMNKTESFYLQENEKNMHIVDEELYFTIDEKNNQIELTDKGRELITSQGEDPNLFVLPDVGAKLHEIESNSNLNEDEKFKKKDELTRDFAEKSERLHSINQLLKAYTLFEKDDQYIVQEGKVLIVDEQTGRVMPGRRYSDGLHQAIEAKENVKVEAATQTFATVTLQNYFRMYHKLGGMTGTAETEASEFFEIYKLDVVVIPTNRPILRDDREDLVYKTRREKYNAVIDEVERLRNEGRPILVGTTSVEVSELMSRMLKMKKIPHNVLNAKQHQREAEIVAEAGKSGMVTIATNMAGRGTDIKLGPGVREAGGLAIIGTERHESRRIDRQLRGRAGRQGDPGMSQFYVSLEDDLMRLFGSERISKIMDRLGLKEGEVIQHSMITKSITNAQKKVEENNFAMRKRLLEYDDVMNSQRDVIYRRRKNALFGDRIKVDLDNMLHEMCSMLASRYYTVVDAESLQMDCIRMLSVDPKISEHDLGRLSEEQVAEKIYDEAKAYYKRKTKNLAETMFKGLSNFKNDHPDVGLVRILFTEGNRRIVVDVDVDRTLETEGREVVNALEKGIMLGMIDEKWKTHLREMDELRQSVQNAVFEQKDPLLVYKFEAFELFQQMLSNLNVEVISTIYKAELDLPKQNMKEAAGNERDDFSKLKANQPDIQKEQRQQQQQLATNDGGGQQDRPLTRRQRREMDRKKK